MATTRIRTATVRQENGHQVIVLPDDIRIRVDGDEVVVRQDLDTGEVTVNTMPTPHSHWQSVFDAIDAHGPIPDEEWDAFGERMASARASRQDRNPFDDAGPQ